MKTLFYPEWDRLEVREQPIPKIAGDEVLLRVAACGICGSELETFKNRNPRRTPPLIMGHEFCGTIVESGDAFQAFHKGQKVISHSVANCGACRPCRRGNTHLCENRQIFGMHRPGAFAEFINVPAQCLIRWPEDLPAATACLAEPLANGVHVANLIKTRHPKMICVLGAGPIGLLCQQAAQILLGSTTIVSDFIPERLEIAKKLGAQVTVNARQENAVEVVREITSNEGVDVVIDAVGAATTKQQALEMVRPGGAVVWIGLHENTIAFDSYKVTLPEVTIYGSYAATLHELQEAVNLMASRRVEVESWVQTFPLADGVTAFQKMLAAKGSDVKAVLVP
ncbi:alcohol dehydrogenase catalytic domain-containing protein [bacterium]|nr:MAG: galactitol-1-phosphate 5-dehydrogenase [candidate division KSB1 bacterium]MBC6950433.1 galactitol-1-phosphate 5-dehydrogenase [candidate division KSB1 bacterium]MCE7941705.1 galactitol-1-phosphate 5-dehydrogenase [Chlorobi bacterium CHB1]MCL4707159.1 alcohol dehydrogenase catalytic domain-containing protein [bacterium]MDL1874591.1 zinc-binding dehydrogenase [Cytophagia bacterium CHB2]